MTGIDSSIPLHSPSAEGPAGPGVGHRRAAPELNYDATEATDAHQTRLLTGVGAEAVVTIAVGVVLATAE